MKDIIVVADIDVGEESPLLICCFWGSKRKKRHNRDRHTTPRIKGEKESESGIEDRGV